MLVAAMSILTARASNSGEQFYKIKVICVEKSGHATQPLTMSDKTEYFLKTSFNANSSLVFLN